jgi:phosphohistidine phosphatase SixA
LERETNPIYLDCTEKFPTAGLVVIDFDVKRWRNAAEGLGQLERFETPKSIGDPTDIR